MPRLRLHEHRGDACGYRFSSRTPGDKEKLRPSDVFARRLREHRKARGLTQEQLGEMLTRAGHPMSKTALLGVPELLRIEERELGAGLN